MRVFDIHTHLLPGVDDGPATLAESIETLRHCYEDGTRAAVMTPHMFSPHCGLHSLDEIRRVFDRTLGVLRRLQTHRSECAFLVEMELFLGAENYLSAEFLAALARGEVLPLADGSSLLVEFSPYAEFDAMLSAARRLLDAGFVPVLAHAERYAPIRRCPWRVAELLDEGCVAQVNAAALVPEVPDGGGMDRRGARQRSRGTAAFLLEKGLASVVASDVHNVARRGSRLRRARSVLAESFSEDQIDEWMWNNPRRLVGTAD